MLFDEIIEKSFMNIEEEVHDEDKENVIMAEVSLNALSDNMSRKTITLEGLVGKETVRMLVDTSSTLGYIDSKLADKVKLQSV